MKSRSNNTVSVDEFRFSENNFDLIRLVAAVEVSVRHALHHLAPESIPAWVMSVLAMVPGVPIFFFLSGYLISRAWERSSSATDYFRNRALRLFPALWLCIFISVVALFATGFMAGTTISPLKFYLWLACQGTFLQFWNPDAFRAFGTGVVNGSLWSISVEIQFYCITALVYMWLRRLSSNAKTTVFAVLAISFAALNGGKDLIVERLDVLGGSLLGKGYLVTFLPWYFMFLLGVVAQRLSGIIVPVLVAHWWQTIGLYLVLMMIDFELWGLPLGNSIPWYLVPLMGATVLVCAYCKPGTATRILRKNDVSYGFYIYHAPVINTIMYTGLASALPAVALALGVSLGLGVASWRFVERPVLKWKRNATSLVLTRNS
jgi:peptidoglycan/LPS O-acetylase OafA/YrhL